MCSVSTACDLGRVRGRGRVGVEVRGVELPHRSDPPSPVGSARSSCTQLGASTLERVGGSVRVSSQ